MSGRHRRVAVLVAAGLACLMASCAATAYLVFPDARRGGPNRSSLAAGAVTRPDPRQSATATVPAWFARLPHPPAAPVPDPVTVPTAGPAAPHYDRVPTSQPVAFITLDDGYTRHPEVATALRALSVPVSAFLISTLAESRAATAYFAEVAGRTGSIEAHTVTHPWLAGTGYGFQHEQICASADRLGALFGRRPVLFRPPYGNYDATTLRAARDCGMRAVVTWSVVVEYGRVSYQAGRHAIRSGDILLLRFRSSFPQDFTLALDAIRAAGLVPALLEDYLTVRSPGG